MSDDTLFSEVLDGANRANPYPIYERLRRRPVSRQRDGAYVVSTHAAIRSLLFDPRLSSEDLPPSKRPRRNCTCRSCWRAIRRRAIRA